MILPLIGQDGGGIDLIWWLIPVLCCILTITQREDKTRDMPKDNETFYTTTSIEDSYAAILDKVAEWREDEKTKGTEQKGIVAVLRKLLAGRGKVERFTDLDTISPRLYSVDDITGPLYFELTEVEGGGTVVKITYNPLLKGRMSRLKASVADASAY